MYGVSLSGGYVALDFYLLEAPKVIKTVKYNECLQLEIFLKFISPIQACLYRITFYN